MFNVQIINARNLAKKGANLVSTAQINNANRETLESVVKLADRAQELYAIVKESEGGEIPANIKSFIRNADNLRKDYSARAIDPAYSRPERATFETLGNDLSVIVRLAAEIK
ncbi:VHS1022 protein [Vibrio phage 1]|nr:VHS1022 protein [Vibrio phage 1]